MTDIGEFAFYECESLKSVIIPDSVNEIDSYAFSGCSGLLWVAMSDSVTNIESNAFKNTGILEVYYAGTQDDWDYIEFASGNDSIKNATILFNGDPDIETVVKSGECGDDLTWELSNFGNLTIKGTGAMTDYGYYSSTAPWSTYAGRIKTVTIEEGVTTIGDCAFTGCSKLTNITIPSGVTRIEYQAFGECIKLTNIVFPNSISYISIYAFNDCSSLSNIYFEGTEDEWKSVGNHDTTIQSAVVYFETTKILEIDVVKTDTTTEWDFRVVLKEPLTNNCVYAAAYDSANHIVSVAKSNLATAGSTNVALDKADNAVKIKIFVWTNDMQPITTVYSEEL